MVANAQLDRLQETERAEFDFERAS